ncbi:hypothetical protein [Aureispira anguillae]|uniref:Uncharacterized protein n=1 Tax=Aureispira anguillae TaxID=2864201 RepID=A0A915YL43_9BACT|nr:hypothetical protein [Aureispira anguillae]BDS15208.1 hypothetical protein AsAng_0059920 [Aureispira anguillae]
MSLDITVIVANKNHFNNFEYFAHALGLAVELSGEVPFQKVNNSWKDGFVDVVFSPQGTLVCVPSGEYNIAAASKASQVALLALSQNSTIFNLECAENGSIKRIYTDFNGVIRRNVKRPLQWENEAQDYTQILQDCVRTFTGKALHEYHNQTAIRYGIIK